MFGNYEFSKSNLGSLALLCQRLKETQSGSYKHSLWSCFLDSDPYSIEDEILTDFSDKNDLVNNLDVEVSFIIILFYNFFKT